MNPDPHLTPIDSRDICRDCDNKATHALLRYPYQDVVPLCTLHAHQAKIRMQRAS